MSPSPLWQPRVRCTAALAACLFLSSPVATLAANSGGNVVQDVPYPGNTSYVGSYQPGAEAAANGQVRIDSDFSGVVIGGFSQSGNATGNRVTVSGGTVQQFVSGGSSAYGNATGNSAVITGGQITGNVGGGWVEYGSGNAEGNSATVSDGQIGGFVYGGYSKDSGNATGNSATVSGGTVQQFVSGGSSAYGNATGNSAVITGGQITGNVGGGWVEYGSGNAEGNSATVSDGQIGGFVYGGYSKGSGTATGNSVTVSGGIVQQFVSGGSAYGSAEGNSVVITGGQITGNVSGGWSEGNSGNATGNSLTVSGGTVEGDSTGGYSATGLVTGNNVTVTGGELENIRGGWSDTGTAAGNSVVISGGTVRGSALGGTGVNGLATGNSVTVTGGTIQGSVIGGFSLDTPQGNSVTISGGTVKGLVTGGMAWGGNTTGNSVTITGGTMLSDVTGGDNWGDGTTQDNTVTITGGTVRENVFGGESSTGNAQGNSVTLQGRPRFGANSLLNGGLNCAGGSTVSSGNTLRVLTSGLVAANINWNPYANNRAGAAQNTIQNYVFAMPRTGQTVLSLTGDHNGGGKPTTFAATDTLSFVPFVQPGSVRQTGVSTLITNPNGLVNVPAAWNDQRMQVEQGLALVYDVTLRTTSTSLESVSDVRMHPRSKALTDGRAASMGLVTLGADLAAGKGLESARAATGAQGLAGGSSSSLGLTPFVAMQGGAWSGNGSVDDANGIGLMAGLVKHWSLSNANLFAGAFFEIGTGHSSGSASGLNFNSDATTTGGGLLARADLTQTWLKGLYAEASFRAGGLRQKFNNDFREPFGAQSRYDNTTTYMGLHAGLGYLWQVNEAASLDLYGKYFWNRLDGFDATLAGDAYRFDAMNSHRLRTGARFNYSLNDKVTPYVGAAYEHEFGGRAHASVYGYGLPSETQSGSTAIAEVGLRVTPDKSKGVFVDINLQGLFGNRQGAMGSLMLGYEF